MKLSKTDSDYKEKITNTLKLLNEFFDLNNIDPEISFNCMLNMCLIEIIDQCDSQAEYRQIMTDLADHIWNTKNKIANNNDKE